MIDPDEATLQLRRAWADVQTGVSEPMSGGFWASMHRVRVTGQPDGVPAEVVVRFAPHSMMGAKEAEVQRAVAGQGFATPRVWLSYPDAVRDGWWSVMDFCSGPPLLSDLDGVAVLRGAPRLYRSVPNQLAVTMAALHRLNPQPITSAVRRAAPDVAWSVPDVLAGIRSDAADVGRTDVVAAVDRLGATRPQPERKVVCHGDLHPLNILDADGGPVVLDWTGAVHAEPAYDVAFTELLLANPPIALPRSTAAAVRFAGRLLARRFIAAYARANPDVSLANVGWFRALHSARVIVDVTALRARHGPDAGGHPWRFMAPIAATSLAAATGVGLQGFGPAGSEIDV